MAHFPNFGLLNGMSQHLANSSSTPKVLDYTVDGNNGYTYQPVSTDMVRQSMPTNSSITKQQRFNAAVDELIFTRNSNRELQQSGTLGNSEMDRRQGSIINSLQVQQPVMNTSNNGLLPIPNGSDINNRTVTSSITDMAVNNGLNQQAPMQAIPETPDKLLPTEKFTIHPDLTKEALLDRSNKVSFITIIIVVFAAFMLIQMYLSQKKMEFLIDIATRQSLAQYNRQHYDSLAERYNNGTNGSNY